MKDEKPKYTIMLGPPGSGKGTQAKVLAEKYRFFYFGTGDMMREEAARGTKMGQKFQNAFQRGELVSDDLVEEFVNQKLEGIPPAQKVIFDGYPRTLKQAQRFTKNLIVLDIEVPTDELIERLSTRRICSKCGKIFLKPGGLEKCDVCGGKLIQRSDDSPAIIKQRIAVYKRQSQPLVDYFKKLGVLLIIDGRPAVAVVSKEIELKLKGLL